MRHTQTPVRLRLSGSGGEAYAKYLRKLIKEGGLGHRIVLEDRWISEAEKVDRLADCLGAAYLPLDEDSYGYPSLEASHAGKPVLTTTDSGGVLELVEDGINGFVVEPDPIAIGGALDRLYLDRARATEMGQASLARLQDLNISWKHVLQRLLA
ncbi:MAG: glycosyltransferase family 4 protein [Rhodanobacter sp.]